MDLFKRYELTVPDSIYQIDVSVISECVIAKFKNRQTHQVTEISEVLQGAGDPDQQLQRVLNQCISRIESQHGKLIGILDLSRSVH